MQNKKINYNLVLGAAISQSLLILTLSFILFALTWDKPFLNNISEFELFWASILGPILIPIFIVDSNKKLSLVISGLLAIVFSAFFILMISFA